MQKIIKSSTKLNQQNSAIYQFFFHKSEHSIHGMLLEMVKQDDYCGLCNQLLPLFLDIIITATCKNTKDVHLNVILIDCQK
jgi:hypothetical protein